MRRSPRSKENDEADKSIESSYCSAKSKHSGEPKHESPYISPTHAREAVATINSSTQRSLLQSPRNPVEGSDENIQSHANRHLESTPTSGKEREDQIATARASSVEQPHANLATSPSQQRCTILPENASRPTSVLQRLEARRKALQASSVGDGSKVSGSRSPISRIEDEQQSERKRPDQGLK